MSSYGLRFVVVCMIMAQGACASGAAHERAALFDHPPLSDVQRASTSSTVVIGQPVINSASIPPSADRRRFIEFRGRHSYVYGHSYVIFGAIDDEGAIVSRDGAGLAPSMAGPIGFVLGHLVPVAAATGVSDIELNDDDIPARWRILLTEGEYSEVVAFVRDLQARAAVWHAALSNCNAFVARIAERMGYRSPSVLLAPTEFVAAMRDINLPNAGAAPASVAGKSALPAD